MATTDEATPLQALLALYGALDQAVIRGGAAVEATVERYLPGSTGPNAGWYDELLGFLATGTNVDSPRAEEPPASPDLSDALTILQSQQPNLGAARPPLTALQLSRMVYALGALSHLPADYLPQGWESQFSRTLAIAGPQQAVQSSPFSGTPPSSDDLLALLQSQFRSRISGKRDRRRLQLPLRSRSSTGRCRRFWRCATRSAFRSVRFNRFKGMASCFPAAIAQCCYWRAT